MPTTDSLKTDVAKYIASRMKLVPGNWSLYGRVFESSFFCLYYDTREYVRAMPTADSPNADLAIYSFKNKSGRYTCVLDSFNSL
jgi:hypothetical protein